MNALFRFVARQPPVLGDSRGIFDASRLVAKSPIVTRLRALDSPRRRAAVAALVEADELIDTHDPGLRALLSLAAIMPQSGALPEGDLVAAVRRVFGKDPAGLQRVATYTELRRDLLVAVLCSRLAPRAVAALAKSAYLVGARFCRIIDAVAAGGDEKAALLAKPWAQMITFDRLFPAARSSGPSLSDSGSPRGGVADREESLLERLDALKKATAELDRESARLLPAETDVGDDLSAPSGEKAGAGGAKARAQKKSQPLEPTKVKLVLSRATQAFLSELGLVPGDAESAAEAVARLEREQAKARSQIRQTRNRTAPSLVNLGFGKVTHAGTLGRLRGTEEGPHIVPGAPSTVGKAKVFEGLLMRVEDRIVGYEEGAVARIINIPATAKKDSKSTVRVTTTDLVESEKTDSSSKETEVETQERQSLQTQVQEQVHEELSGRASAGFSADYGAVTAEAATELAMSIGRSTASSSATEFAKTVLMKTLEKMSSVRRERTAHSREVKTSNTEREGYDNATGSHKVGVLRWVDEVHEARLVNYGTLTMMEFVLPRPGAVLLWSAISAARQDLPQPPPPFTVTLDDIEPGGVDDLIERYGLADPPPPPAPVLFVSKAVTLNGDFKKYPSDRTSMTLVDTSLAVPDGYEIARYWALLSATYVENPAEEAFGRLQVTMGYRGCLRLNLRRNRWTALTHTGDTPIVPRNGIFPFAVTGVDRRAGALTVVLKCMPTPERIQAWKQEFYAALLQAHQRRQAEYEDRLRESRRGQPVLVVPRNPAQYRALERDELKRSCIGVITAQNFDAFGALDTGADGDRPRMLFGEVAEEGEYIEFFERAIEWHNLDCLLYPYFWSNPADDWLNALQLQVDDPKHEEFLKAGAARVVVPIRKGFEPAVMTYLSHPERPILWDGQSFDDIDADSELYYPIWRAQMELQGQLEEAPAPVGTPWRFSVPTNHQIISGDGTLPAPPPLP